MPVFRPSRKHWSLLAIFLAIVGASYGASTLHKAPASSSSSSGCDAHLWDFVYHPARLVNQSQGCITTVGVIGFVRHEADGDDHIGIQLDPGQPHLTNAKNDADQHGDLVVEPICQHSVTQADAVGACSRYVGPMFNPVVGQHVRVTGTYVLDQQHGWMEQHPISVMVVVA